MTHPALSPLAYQLLTEALTTRRKVFLSYHHDNDQWYYNQFSQVFHATYEAVQDNSLDRAIDSDDPEYVMRRIRDNCITGSSCTIILCGSATPWRKYVDWEIKATLDKQHGLIGVNLPSNPLTPQGLYIVPDRLHENIVSGYALWLQWSNLTLGPDALKLAVEHANAKDRGLIRNGRDLRQRNG